MPLPAAVILLGDLQAAAGATKQAARTFDLVRSIVRLQQASGAVTDLETAIFEADHGDPARALPAAQAAYAARPDNVYAADALAWSLVRSGDAAAAQPLMAQALRLGSADAAMHYHAAVIADALGDARQRAPRARVHVRPQPVLQLLAARRGRRAGYPPRGSHPTEPGGWPSVMVRKALVALGIVVGVVAMTPALASAHPLGNFTVNTYAGLQVEAARVSVDYVVDMAEIPTLQRRPDVDRNDDGTVQPAESRAYRTAECARMAKGLHLTVDDAALRLAVGATRLTFPPGQAGLSTMRLECRLHAPIAATAGAHR